MSSNIEDEEFKVYIEDRRIPCRYGSKCYQKNPIHHKKYKHPPSKDKKKIGKASAKVKVNNKRKSKEEDVTEKKDEVPQAKMQKLDSEISDVKSSEVSDNSANNISEKENSKESESSSEDESLREMEEDNKKEEASAKLGDPLVNEKEDISDAIESTNLAQTIIQNLFLVKMPNDFYQFYDFCKFISKKDPLKALKSVSLELVGAYDVLTGQISNYKDSDKEKYLRHWRYYYDPPEFQTVIKGNKDGLHFGYWRDDLSESPVFVAKNKAARNCIIEPVAKNIFGAVNTYIEDMLKLSNPFERANMMHLHKRLKDFATEKNITLQKNTSSMRQRDKKVVARTLHSAGIVVPYNKQTQLGYRDLAVTDKELQKILQDIDEAGSSEERKKSMSKLDEVVRLATIAADECDFGTCLELAHDLFASGSEHVTHIILQMFSIAYTHLQRLGLLQIAQSHLKDRKRGDELSVI